MGRCLQYTAGTASVLLLIASISLLVAHVFQNVVELRVKEEAVLKNGTDAFEAWKNPPPPIYMQFYFFNVTNPLEVLSGEKPVVEEMGPYTYRFFPENSVLPSAGTVIHGYSRWLIANTSATPGSQREYRPKEDVEFLDNGTKLTAVSPKTYVFEPEKSVGDPLVDRIRTVNIPAMTVMEMTKDNFVKREIASGLLTHCGEEMFATHTVHEWLWGYRDCVLADIHTIILSIDPVFGLFYKMNTTNDGEYAFFSGADNYTDVAKIVKWRGNETLNWWTSDSCNEINGTDGTYFHPLISKDETLYMFSSDLCRSLYALYESTVTVNGISAFRFVPPAKVFANKTENPDNAGFCVPAGKCLGSGLLNVSRCKQDAPIILSSPHFYQADNKFVMDIDGMRPKKEDHETFLDIDPDDVGKIKQRTRRMVVSMFTGILVRVAKRMQINVYVRQVPGFTLPGNIKTLVFPIMYLNESVLIDEDSAGKLKFILRDVSVVVNIPFMIMALGVLFGIIFIVVTCRAHGLYPRREEGTPEETGPLIRTT